MTAPERKHIVIVGAGPGGLTSAMILAHRGFKVTVFEAKERVGGRNAALQLDGYTFDTGPTFLMLKDVLDEVLKEAGTSTEAEMECIRLDPMYRLAFSDRYLEPTNDKSQMLQEIERCFPGHSAQYARFFDQEKTRFTRLFPCLQKSYHNPATLVHPDLLKALPALALGKSLFDVMYSTFRDEKLALSFTFQSKYLGMSPWECPGLFAMIPYIEHAFGIFHVTGGLSRISDSMAEVARRQGAVINCGRPVRKVIVRNGSAVGVELDDGERVEADEVVINADFGYAATKLFDDGILRKWTPARLENTKYSCSTYMMYLGVDKIYNLPHHTIFFADDYRSNVDAIFQGRRVGKDISFYVRNSAVTDRTVAPAGHSAVYVLVPVANLRGEPDWDMDGESFRENVLHKLETRAGMADIRKHIVREKVVGPNDWQDSYNCYAGATFNLAHNMMQMIYWRPHNKFEDVDRCYLVGGGTHPGSGLPTIYESGRIAANLISRKHNLVFVSGNLEV
jgi:phytoene desaturase